MKDFRGLNGNKRNSMRDLLAQKTKAPIRLERCKSCGGVVETLFNENGENPLRCCWACEAQAVEREANYSG